MPETEALLAKEPTVTIAGRKYELNPLGLEASAPLARLLEITEEHTGITITDLFELTQDRKRSVKFLLSALAWANDEVMLLLAMLFGVPQEELRDPKRFPLASFGALFVPLAQQVDIAGFLSGQAAATSGEEKQQMIPADGPSDESAGRSSAEPAGPTSNSEDSGSLAG